MSALKSDRSKCPLLVATRRIGLDPQELGFPQAKLEGWTQPEQQRSFLRKFFGLTRDETAADANADAMMRTIAASPTVAQGCAVSLFLTLLALQEEARPEGSEAIGKRRPRHDYYAGLVECLCDGRHQTRASKVPEIATQVCGIKKLDLDAFWSDLEITRLIRPERRPDDPPTVTDAQVPWGFLHRNFLEYFAGERLWRVYRGTKKRSGGLPGLFEAIGVTEASPELDLQRWAEPLGS